QKRRAFLRDLIDMKLIKLAVDLGQDACRRFGYLRGVDSCYALVGRVEQAVEAGHDAVEVEVLQLLDDVARRGEELRERRLGARDVDVVRLPRNRQLGIDLGIDVIDLQVVGSRDALRRKPDAQSLFDLHVHRDRKSTRLNSSHVSISYAVFCLKKKKKKK